MKRLILVASVLLMGCGASVEDRFIEACEEVFVDRLRSPSTYVRTHDPIVRVEPIPWRSVDEVREELEEASEYAEANPDDSAASLREIRLILELSSITNGDPERLNYYTVIRYDADNAYGTPIAGAFECEGEWKEDSGGWLDEGNLLINGMTRMEYIQSLAP